MNFSLAMFLSSVCVLFLFFCSDDVKRPLPSRGGRFFRFRWTCQFATAAPATSITDIVQASIVVLQLLELVDLDRCAWLPYIPVVLIATPYVCVVEALILRANLAKAPPSGP